ncbi:MAG: cytochrome-c oxidase, cbb3-type subunit III [Pseudomonadota bacterium]|nr:cytochrome-c oxidase, cbb3-type subunit III [Pseudomonadota bacterium]
MAQKEMDDVSGVETTGHEWDGIKELNNPLPRWWLWTFYACIVWAIAYVIFFPALPVSGSKGVLGYSSRAEVAQEMVEAREAQSGMYAKMTSLSLDEIRADPEAFQFAVAGGRAAFAVNCSQCHGAGASGGPGYPNLNDDDWLWGGSLDSIYQTLQHGIRFQQNEETRQSLMPAFGRDGILEPAQIEAIAEYSMQLGGLEHDAAKAAEGAPLYAENCAACHGEKGEGDREQGAPKLADAIWLYAGDASQIARQIHDPKHGVMPAWGHRLPEATIRQLAIYVHSLGGGE